MPPLLYRHSRWLALAVLPLLSSSSQEIWDLPLQPQRLKGSQGLLGRPESTEPTGPTEQTVPTEPTAALEILETPEPGGFKAIPGTRDAQVQLLRFQAQWATREPPEPQVESGLLE